MRSLKILLVTCAIACAVGTHAQDFPARPIRIIVPNSAGTGTDATARFLADRLAKEWNQGVAVENKVGASGILGQDFVAKSAPDGYTLLMGLSPMYVNKSVFKSLPFDPVKDFRVLLGVNELFLVMVVPASSPLRTIKDLVDRAQKQPGKVSYGSAGTGSLTHLGPALLGALSNAEFLHVPYKGGAQAITDTMSGQVDFAFTAIATAAPQVAAGRLRALGTSGKARSRSLPQVPTLEEAGVRGFQMSSKTFLAAPAGLPSDVADKIVATVGRVIRSPDYLKFLETQGFEPEILSPEAFQSVPQDEVKYWAEIVRLSGVKSE